MKSHWWVCIFTLHISYISCQIPRYYNGSGNFENKCPTTECPRCSIGEFRQACASTSQGYCSPCNGQLPENALWVTDGWFNNSCKFGCSPAYSLVGGVCVVKPDSVYVVSMSIAIPLSAADVNTQKLGIVMAFSALSNCGTCGSYTASPIICQRCRIFLTVQQTAARRLLAPTSTVSVTIEQLSGSSQAAATASALTDTNINTLLSLNSIPNVVILAPAAVQVQPAPVTTSLSTPGQTTARTTSAIVSSQSSSSVTASSVPVTDRRGLPVTPAPPAPATNDSGGSNVGVIVGAVVGGVVFLVGLAVCVCCFTVNRTPFQQKDAQLKSVPPAAAAAAAAPPSNSAATSFNVRHNRRGSMVQLNVPIDFQRPPPPNTILITGPICMPHGPVRLH